MIWYISSFTNLSPPIAQKLITRGTNRVLSTLRLLTLTRLNTFNDSNDACNNFYLEIVELLNSFSYFSSALLIGGWHYCIAALLQWEVEYIICAETRITSEMLPRYENQRNVWKFTRNYCYPRGFCVRMIIC